MPEWGRLLPALFFSGAGSFFCGEGAGAGALATALNALGPGRGLALALAVREGWAVRYVERDGGGVRERWSPAFERYRADPAAAAD